MEGIVGGGERDGCGVAGGSSDWRWRCGGVKR